MKEKENCECGEQRPESMLYEPTANINNEAQKANIHALSLPFFFPACELALRQSLYNPAIGLYRPSVKEHDMHRPVKRHADSKAQTGIYQRVLHS